MLREELKLQLLLTNSLFAELEVSTLLTPLHMIQSHLHPILIFPPNLSNVHLNVTLISSLDFQMDILQVFPINILHAFLISPIVSASIWKHSGQQNIFIQEE